MEKFNINGIDTFLLSTKKFKTLSFFVVFFGEFNKENATPKSLLTRLLSNSTKHYPTKKDIANKLFDLYDANVSVSSFPIYKTNLTIFSLEIVNPKLVNDNNLLKEATAFFQGFIFHANADKGSFNETVFNEEYRILRDHIKNVYNNKTMYAFNRMLEEMAKDEIISVSSMGTLEALEKITPNSIYQEYEKLISEEMARIYVIGDITQEEVIDIFKTFPFKVNHLTLEASSMEEKHVTKVKEVIETQNINQAQLMMGFRTNVNALDELYIPMSVFNMMFGGMVSSDLFRVVREENSLAYNVSSSIFFSNRLLVVNAGIDSKNYQLTTDLVIKELERYKNGDIDANLMQVAKDNLISGLQETDDNDFSYLMFVIKNSLLKNYTVEDVIKLINQVTVEEVHQASQMIELDTIYCLRGEDHE